MLRRVATYNLLKRLGDEIRARRRQLDLSQEALAHKAGVHRNVVGRLERGKYNPSILTLLSIATILEVGLSSLIAAAEASGHDSTVKDRRNR
jgi:transcriptional regulator with XRE-family HTH domain